MNEFKKEFITFCRRVVSLHVIVYFLAGIFALLRQRRVCLLRDHLRKRLREHVRVLRASQWEVYDPPADKRRYILCTVLRGLGVRELRECVE